MRRFTITNHDGTTSTPVTRRRVLFVAGRRLIAGAGPFTVYRDRYAHPGLHRAAALDRIAAMTLNVIVGEHITAKDRAGALVLDVTRVRASEYLNPFRDTIGVRGLREDQGVDYSVAATSPVYAIGPGIVTIYRPTSGWPLDPTHPTGGAYIAYRLTAGPAVGKYVYDAEHITLSNVLRVGASVGVHTLLATHHPGFANCETGWALPSNDGYSPLAVMGYGGTVPQFHEGDRTAAGVNFDSLMVELGAPPGLTEGRPIAGTLPPGYPKSWAGLV